MEEKNLTVIGSYSTREEALSVIERLRNEGYERDDIVIYTTDEAASRLGFDGLSGIDVETDEKLVQRADFAKLMQESSPEAHAELQWRFALIFAVPLMALLAVPMSSVNPRQGRFAKLLPALLLYLIYFLLQSSLKSAGSSGKVDVRILMPLVSIAFLLLGIVLNSWNSKWFSALRYRFSAKKVAA